MCMYDPDGEYPEFYLVTQRKARKPHRCGECRRTIEAGEEYENVTGKWDGVISTYKTCRHCTSVRDWLVIVCDGFLFGCVREDLLEHYREGYGIWLGRAALSMKHKWRKRNGSLRSPMKLPAELPLEQNL